MAYGSSFARSLYYSSPRMFRDVVASIYGLRERRERYGAEFYRALAFLEKAQWWDNDALAAFQQGEVQRFLESAVNHAPYYRNREQYQDWRDIAALPLLSKQEVRVHATELYSSVSLKRRTGQTSGTTGTPLRFPVSLECFQREYAFRALHYSWGHVSLHGKEKIGIIAGHPVSSPEQTHPPFWVHDHANNWLLMSSYHLTQRNLRLYVQQLERFQPVLLGGYPSSIYLLAAAYEKYGQVPIQLRAVFTGSETLYPYQRELIERAFGVKAFNWYGNSEMCANIVECERGEMHLKLEHSYVEVLDNKDRQCQPGETGRLVCTGFGNYAFPLIRYEVGDVVTLSPATRSLCGRGGILVSEVIGREEEYVFTPDGRIVGRLDHLFKEMENVVEAQLQQDVVDELIVRIVKAPGFTAADETRILTEARQRLGDAIRVRTEYIENIPRGRNGKYRFIISSIDQREALENLVG